MQSMASDLTNKVQIPTPEYLWSPATCLVPIACISYYLQPRKAVAHLIIDHWHIDVSLADDWRMGSMIAVSHAAMGEG